MNEQESYRSYFPSTNSYASQQQQVIFVRKDRQREYDNTILNQWKNKRIKFYADQISNRQQGKCSNVKYLNQQFSEKLRICLPIQYIILKKITTLKRMHIQYNPCQPKITVFGTLFEYHYRYAISAFVLFKVVHDNRQLNEVTLRGVLTEDFQQFLEQLRKQKSRGFLNWEYINRKEEQVWMKDFSPSKFLKLTINTKVLFEITEEQQTLSSISHLMFFVEMLQWLSDITVNISFINNLEIMWAKSMDYLLEQLKKLKRIKVNVKGGGNRITSQQIPVFRSLLFGGLSLFTEITQLSFNNIEFSEDISVVDFLAIEQILSTIFQNNAITQLNLDSCRNFPNFPHLGNLQQINFRWTQFVRNDGFIRRTIETNASLKSIICDNVYHDLGEECGINEELFDQLQTLILNSCINNIIDTPSLRTTSNIRYLHLSQSNMDGDQCLSSILLKLNNLISLKIYDIPFGDETLCTIPSVDLEELHIYRNNEITIRGLEVALHQLQIS